MASLRSELQIAHKLRSEAEEAGEQAIGAASRVGEELVAAKGSLRRAEVVQGELEEEVMELEEVLAQRQELINEQVKDGGKDTGGMMHPGGVGGGGGRFKLG